jgi:hypothetical protein
MLPLLKTRWATGLTAAIFLSSLVLLLSGCSQPSKPVGGDTTTATASEPSNPSEPVTAKTALLPMYSSAYKWAHDVVLLRLTPKDVPGVEKGAGKAAVWEATYASSSQHACHVYTYAVAAQPPDIYKGVTVGSAIPWAGITRDVLPIESSAFNVDSDAAYTAAAADAAAWLKKNPGVKLSRFQLGNGYSFPAPVWYVMWGDKKLGYVAFVNATTGKVIKK